MLFMFISAGATSRFFAHSHQKRQKATFVPLQNSKKNEAREDRPLFSQFWRILSISLSLSALRASNDFRASPSHPKTTPFATQNDPFCPANRLHLQGKPNTSGAKTYMFLKQKASKTTHLLLPAAFQTVQNDVRRNTGNAKTRISFVTVFYCTLHRQR